MENEKECIQKGLVHAWQDITEYGICYPTNPPQYPPHTERCANCGLKKIKRIKPQEEWWEYE